MLKLNKDQKRLPIGGHQYHDYGRTFRGESFEEVVKKLGDFRITNHINFGNPQQDVLNYYATNWPYMVKEDREAQEVVENEDYVNWRSWINSAWKTPPKKIVTPREAKDRWDICKGCAFNKPKSWGETKESAELTRMAYLLRRGIAVPQNLGFCSLHRSDLSVFTFLDAATPFSGKKDAGENKECWVK